MRDRDDLVPATIAHHIMELDQHPDLARDIDNLEVTMCIDVIASTMRALLHKMKRLRQIRDSRATGGRRCIVC